MGSGDAADFIKFQLDEAGKIQPELDADTADALKSKQIKLSCLNENGKAVALTSLNDDNMLFSKQTVNAGDYYPGMTCANVQKFNTTVSPRVCWRQSDRFEKLDFAYILRELCVSVFTSDTLADWIPLPASSN